MARIRKIVIGHFRGIQKLEWCPSAGLNCLIGPGDSGKSSILDAVDFCLGARRNIQFTDADFHLLDVNIPITIEVTLGELDDQLKNLEAYGMFVQGFNYKTYTIEDEPDNEAETVLTVKLTVTSDLEPSWTLVSERAEAQGLTRNLNWADRIRLSPTRIGVMADYHLGWRRGSVLNRVSEERADASAALANAARDARIRFGNYAQKQLSETLDIVMTTAKELGIPIGENIKAMLDAQSVSFTGGSISLHDENGVPLRGLGVGSTRLLIAGLQRKASEQSTIILIDELEHGLEPHRIIRLLNSLGSKDTPPPLQVFMTTHSPVALRELSGNQLFIVRGSAKKHKIQIVGTDNDIQGTIRLYPDALLSPNVIVCEGASEVGLIRGLDKHRVAQGKEAITALGTVLVDCGGGDADKPFKRAAAFHALGYRVAVVRDADQEATPLVVETFLADGGTVISWHEGRALEDELFMNLTGEGVSKLLERAVELHGEDLINDNIKSASQNVTNLKHIRTEIQNGGITQVSRALLGKASRSKKAGWFKSVSWMEDVARDIVGPDLAFADASFRKLVEHIFAWVRDAKQ